MAQTLPGEITVLSRDEAKAKWLRDYRFRDPQANTGPGTQPDIEASVFADSAMPLYDDAQKVGNGVNVKTSGGKWLDMIGEAEGVPRPLAVGSEGFVLVSASVGGGNIFAGDQLTNTAGLRFQCVVTAVYLDGQPCPIAAVDTGPGTNLDSGAVLSWAAPRPGIGPTAIVEANFDGAGLTGGRDKADDPTYQQVIIQARQVKPASGNGAEYRRLVETTPGLQVQKAFSYSGIFGPGTIACVFLMQPTKPGAGRRPNGTQIAQSAAFVVGQMPADDSYFPAAVLPQPTDVVLRVSWQPSALGWVDASPWPHYYAGGSAIVVTAANNAAEFTLDGDHTFQPQVGQTIGFFDRDAQLFRRKRIKTVGGAGPWVITCETANAASDATYTPIVGQRACPWSESLADLVTPVISYFDTLGPGEMFDVFYDPGTRQRRQPMSPTAWPITTSTRMLIAVLDVTSVLDASVQEGLGVTPTVGTVGVAVNLLEARYLTVFPQ